ncbi:MAG: hypothetical protein ACD_5C00325G0001 [uncultured bacterium]|nr:MAG: hypothetical protein ACD_5C00325G0001 [uncultured bacterium]
MLDRYIPFNFTVMNNKNEKPDANEFKIQFKKQLSQRKREEVIDAIKKSPQYARYYHLQDNDWYEIRSSKNQNWHNPADVQILLKDEFMLIMKPVDDNPWWTQLDNLKECLKDDIEKVSVSVENYWE